MADLRSALEEAFEKKDTEEVAEPVEVEAQAEEAPIVEQPRDEKGRFTAEEKPEEPVEVEAQADETPIEQTEVQEEPKLQRPTTWKKEYLPLWDKMEKGEALSKEEAKKMLEYANQRESEYKKGVSAYKAEADSAKSLREAIEIGRAHV